MQKILTTRFEFIGDCLLGWKMTPNVQDEQTWKKTTTPKNNWLFTQKAICSQSWDVDVFGKVWCGSLEAENSQGQKGFFWNSSSQVPYKVLSTREEHVLEITQATTRFARKMIKNFYWKNVLTWVCQGGDLGESCEQAIAFGISCCWKEPPLLLETHDMNTGDARRWLLLPFQYPSSSLCWQT